MSWRCGPRVLVLLILSLAGLPAWGAGDFTISVSPTSRTVTQGTGTTYTVTITPLGGFKDTVAVTVGGLPAGASAPAPYVQPRTAYPIYVTTSVTTPPGTYPLTFRYFR